MGLPSRQSRADLAFCLNVLFSPTGCDPDSTVLGQCCFIDNAGQQQCLVLTQNECDHNYTNGRFASGGTCAAPCPPALCVITCQAGDAYLYNGNLLHTATFSFGENILHHGKVESCHFFRYANHAQI